MVCLCEHGATGNRTLLTYLNALLESPMVPTVILATNCGQSFVRRTSDMVSPHGVPRDFLDRRMAIHAIKWERLFSCVLLYSRGIKIRLRCCRLVGSRGEEELATVWNVLSIQYSSPVLIAFATRYALQLLTPASILVQLAGRSQIELEDIGEMTELFLDAKTSVRNLAKGE
ncbi:hypothetical protein F5888DRAFT_1369294 [Russula emetica]|nr:hypothetical protein F5888DRAFT_1369294 [Russula emetica]